MNYRRSFWFSIATGVAMSTLALYWLWNLNGYLFAVCGFAAHVDFLAAWRLSRAYHDYARALGHPPDEA